MPPSPMAGQVGLIGVSHLLRAEVRRMAGAGRFVHLDAQARLLRRQHVAVDDCQRLDNELCHRERHIVRVNHLLDDEIGRRKVNMDAGCRRDRTIGVVRGETGVIDFSHRGDAANLADAAGVTGVRLQQAGRARFEDLAKAPAGKEPLPRCNGDVRCPGDLRHGRRIFRLNRLLHEKRVVGLKSMCVANRHLRRNPPVHIQQYVHVVADRLPHRLQPGLSFIQHPRPVEDVCNRHGNGFDGVPPFGRLGQCALRHRLGRAAAKVRVHAHTVAYLAAEKLVDWLARLLAFDVP